MKFFSFFLIFCTLYIYGFGKELPVRFFINGRKIVDKKFYLVNSGKAYLLPYTDNTKNSLVVSDSLSMPYRLLLIYKKYKVIINVSYPDTKFLEIYFDNRLFNNIANSKSGGDWFKPKYIFKKKYLVLYGNGLVSIVVPAHIDYLRTYDLKDI